MSHAHYADRNGCALHGVIKALDAIKGVVPIVHANAGCSLNARFSANTFNGATGRHFRSLLEIGGTTLFDKHVVFGGTSRLREQIKNSVKVLNGDLYVVATGCVPEIIGDDVPAMVKEAREQRFPVLGITAPGFKGSAYTGYAASIKSLLAGIDDLFPEPTPERKPLLVNLLGIVPEQDPFWEGDLLELENILAELGVETNRLLGVGQDIREWKQARKASLTIVLSPWGTEGAAYLAEKHRIPTLHLGWLPVGSKDVGRLLEQVASHLELDEQKLDGAKRRLERRLRYFLQKSASLWLEQDLQKASAVVAPASYAVGLSRFLASTLGHPVVHVIITDEPAEELRQELIAAIRELSPTTEVSFTPSQQTIAEQLQLSQPEFIFASHLEQEVAQRLEVPLLEIATPVRQSLILSRSYAGIAGALTLVEEFGAAVLAANSASVRIPGAQARIVTPKAWQERRQRADEPAAGHTPDTRAS